MSAQEFKPGDRVRCIETWTTHVIDSGDEFTVDIRGTVSGVQQVYVQGEWVPARYFEKVEPEFVVGQQEFKPGDRVRCVDVTGQPSENLKLDDTALYTVASITHHGWLTLTSNPGPWLPSRFVKVDLETTEPEFVVGQQVSGNDYERLPVGSKVKIDGDSFFSHTKIADNRWRSDIGKEWPNAQLAGFHRTLTHLPDAAEPEDKADLYVEPEPLKAGDWALAWVRIEAPKPDKDGDVSVSVPLATVSEIESGVYFRADAIVRPDAGQVPPWVKPAQCTSLWEASPNDYARCIKDEHDDTEQHNRPGIFWTDAEAYGRVEVSS